MDEPHFNTTHGLTDHPIRTTHNCMLKRCYNKNNNRYHIYGGRGIEVCKEWHDLKTFSEWAFNNGFKPGLQIDRIDNNGNYEPSNCRFVSRSENIRNRPYTITKEQAKEVKDLYDNGMMVKDIANKLNYSKAKTYRLINMIKNNKDTSS